MYIHIKLCHDISTIFIYLYIYFPKDLRLQKLLKTGHLYTLKNLLSFPVPCESPPRLQPDLTKLHVLTRPRGDDGTVGDGWWLVVGG